jgi:hypothetical protein
MSPLSDVQAKTLMLRPEVVVTVIEDGAVLLDLDSKYFYSVNQTGWAILQMFEAGTTREQVENRCHNWGAASADAAPITRFLDALVGDNLVTPTEWVEGELNIQLNRPWSAPTIEKSREPLQRIMKSPFDPTLPLAE